MQTIRNLLIELDRNNEVENSAQINKDELKQLIHGCLGRLSVDSPAEMANYVSVDTNHHVQPVKTNKPRE